MVCTACAPSPRSPPRTRSVSRRSRRSARGSSRRRSRRWSPTSMSERSKPGCSRVERSSPPFVRCSRRAPTSRWWLTRSSSPHAATGCSTTTPSSWSAPDCFDERVSSPRTGSRRRCWRGCRSRRWRDAKRATGQIRARGVAAVVITGGHFDGPESVDVLDDRGTVIELSGPRLEGRSTHGTGCTFAAAVTAELARGQDLGDAVAGAKRYVEGAIRHAEPLGRGHGPINHFWSE